MSGTAAPRHTHTDGQASTCARGYAMKSLAMLDGLASLHEWVEKGTTTDDKWASQMKLSTRRSARRYSKCVLPHPS
jgi:hypothetical protein